MYVAKQVRDSEAQGFEPIASNTCLHAPFLKPTMMCLRIFGNALSMVFATDIERET
jgi:hypothetical protein